MFRCARPPIKRSSYHGSEDHYSSRLEGSKGGGQVKVLCWLVSEETLPHHDLSARPNDQQVYPRVGPPVSLPCTLASSHMVHLAGVKIVVSVVVASIYSRGTCD